MGGTWEYKQIKRNFRWHSGVCKTLYQAGISAAGNNGSRKKQTQQEAERQAEEDAYRKHQEQLKLEKENRRKEAEKLAQLAAQKENHAMLIKLRKEQKMIIAANRGWFWCKKAKVQRAAQSKLREIECELDSLPVFD